MENLERNRSKFTKILIVFVLIVIIAGAFSIFTYLFDNRMQSTKVTEVFSDFDADGDVDFIVEADIIINDSSPFLVELEPTNIPEILQEQVPTSVPMPQATVESGDAGGGEVDRDGDWSLSPGWPTSVSQWEMYISEAAREFYVSPDIIAAVIMKESQGQASVTGKAGEQGLMQIMPRFHSCATYEPRANIFCGTSILAGHIQYYSGDIKTALAAYNGGRKDLSVGQQYATVVLGTLNYYVGK